MFTKIQKLILSTKKHEYFLRKNLYFAKNHRIVTINFDALISEAPITIQLFDGEFVNYLPLEVDQSKREVIRWKGIIENPPFTSDELVDQSTSEEDANRVFEAIFGVEFGASGRVEP